MSLNFKMILCLTSNKQLTNSEGTYHYSKRGVKRNVTTLRQNI
jgi:hypothetical protein